MGTDEIFHYGETLSSHLDGLNCDIAELDHRMEEHYDTILKKQGSLDRNIKVMNENILALTQLLAHMSTGKQFNVKTGDNKEVEIVEIKAA